MNAPFAFSWGTFAAVLVVVATIVLAVVWAVVVSHRDGGGEGRDE